MSKCDDILSLQFFNLEVNDFEAKVVLKPLDYDRKWKFQYKPLSGDVQLLSKKIPVTKFLNLQVLFFCKILLIGIVFCDRKYCYLVGKSFYADNCQLLYIIDIYWRVKSIIGPLRHPSP